jgi:hypothetical protein
MQAGGSMCLLNAPSGLPWLIGRTSQADNILSYFYTLAFLQELGYGQPKLLLRAITII